MPRSYTELANQLEIYLKEKTLFQKFTKEDLCCMFDHRFVSIEIAVPFLEQSKNHLKPTELFEVLQHWRIRFGWDANKASKISLLLSENLKAPFFNDYIRYFIKAIMNSYEDAIKESKYQKKQNDLKKKENKELKEQNENYADQIEMYQEIKTAHINFLLEQAEKIEVAEFRVNNFKKIIDRKETEIEDLKAIMNRQAYEIRRLKDILNQPNAPKIQNNPAMKYNNTQIKVEKPYLSPIRPVMGSPTQVYIPRSNSGTNILLKQKSSERFLLEENIQSGPLQKAF